MKQIVITQHGDTDVLKIQEKSDPTPSSGEVLIKVKAIGINFADILARKGLYPDAPKPPCVVGYEVSGVIESVGQGVDSSKIGNPVFALTRFNGYSDKVCVSEKAVFPIPESLDFEKAAVIPVNYLTAYQLVHVMGGLKKGESVLIHNAGGGVGLAALDIATPSRGHYIRNIQCRQAFIFERKGSELSHRLPQSRFSFQRLRSNKRQGRRTDHRSDWRKELEKELQSASINGTLGYVWCFYRD
jgi:D-arabinose 1-dehydrogenase-like Zn-dependent alcohol dehydrogenase